MLLHLISVLWGSFAEIKLIQSGRANVHPGPCPARFGGSRISTPQASFHICNRVQCDPDVTLFSESADGLLLSTTLLVVSLQTVLWRGHVHSLVLRLLISQQPPSRSPPPNPKAP